MTNCCEFVFPSLFLSAVSRRRYCRAGVCVFFFLAPSVSRSLQIHTHTHARTHASTHARTHALFHILLSFPHSLPPSRFLSFPKQIARLFLSSYILHPTPYTLHPTPFTPSPQRATIWCARQGGELPTALHPKLNLHPKLHP